MGKTIIVFLITQTSTWRSSCSLHRQLEYIKSWRRKIDSLRDPGIKRMETSILYWCWIPFSLLIRLSYPHTHVTNVWKFQWNENSFFFFPKNEGNVLKWVCIYRWTCMETNVWQTHKIMYDSRIWSLDEQMWILFKGCCRHTEKWTMI